MNLEWSTGSLASHVPKTASPSLMDPASSSFRDWSTSSNGDTGAINYEGAIMSTSESSPNNDSINGRNNEGRYNCDDRGAFSWSDIHRRQAYRRGSRDSFRQSHDQSNMESSSNFKRSRTPPHNGIKHRSVTQNELQSDVRELTRFLMHRKSHEAPIDSISKEMAWRYKTTRNDTHGPDIHNLVLDFTTKETVTPWNKRAAELFAEEYVSHEEYSCKDHAQIEKVFFVHINYLGNIYRKALEMEDLQDARDREKEKARIMRRRLLYRRRKQAFNNSNVGGMLSHWVVIWKYMKMEAMSGDETDYGPETPEQAVITRLPWRNPAVDNWLRLFDKLHLLSRFHDDGRPTPGQFPHHRVPSYRLERHISHAAVGLPRNFYCEDFLACLNPSELRKLEIKEPVDLSLSKELL
ncbi:hypothetical protein C0992_005187, partial [Termitomyces sp. T32_za158]